MYHVIAYHKILTISKPFLGQFIGDNRDDIAKSILLSCYAYYQDAVPTFHSIRHQCEHHNIAIPNPVCCMSKPESCDLPLQPESADDIACQRSISGPADDLFLFLIMSCLSSDLLCGYSRQSNS
jgi:hypothetical protein